MATKLDFGVQMQKRTKDFSIQAIKFFTRLPKSEAGRVIGWQLLRSATSVGANYRAACRAKSEADFISKLGTVVEEADESRFWIELLEEAGIVTATDVEQLKREADELVRILQTSLTTAKRNSRNSNSSVIH